MARKPANEAASSTEQDDALAHDGPATGDPMADNPTVIETKHGPAVVVTATGQELTTFSASTLQGMKVRRRIASPVLDFPVGVPMVIRIMDAIHTGKVIEGVGKKYDKPAQICIVQAPDGQQRTMICNAVLEKELNENYPNDGYVGAWFYLVKLPKKSDKTYHVFEIVEIDPPTAAAA